MDHLFVYGSLRSDSGHAMSAWLAGVADRVGSCSVAARLHDVGPYRCAVPAAPTDGAAALVGELHRLREPSSALPVLDAYEGCGPEDAPPHLFVRGTTTASLDDGRRVEAWIYWYRGPLPGEGGRRAADVIR